MTVQPNELTIAAISMCSQADKAANIATAFTLIKQAADIGANWILLPEFFPYRGPYECLYAMAEDEEGTLIQRLAELAESLGVILFAGTMGLRSAKSEISTSGCKKVYNTTLVFDRKGKVIARYRKTHLFNLFDSHGKKLFAEGDGFIAGNEVVTFDVDGFRVGLGICYDLRFPGLFTRMTKDEPVDIIALPSAFTRETGAAHWELLLKARAVENQCYMFAADQCGEQADGKAAAYGHSMIIDPWGEKLGDSGSEEGIAIATISKDRILEVRARLPALKNRRQEMY